MNQYSRNTLKIIFNLTVVYLLVCGVLFNCSIVFSSYQDVKSKIEVKLAERAVVDKDIQNSYEYKYLKTTKGSEFSTVPVIQRFDINDNGNDAFAKEIVYKFILEWFKDDKFSYEITEQLLSKRNIWAHRYDLNNDGRDEILGFYKSTDFVFDEKFYLFILKKVGDKYVDVYRCSLPMDINSIVVFNDTLNAHNNLGFVQWSPIFSEAIVDLVVYQKR